MADTTAIKNKIVIEGEAQYRKAMRDITLAIKEQRSALKAASAEYTNAEGDMRDASRVSKAFEQTIEEQGRALAEMEKHLKEVEKAYAEAGEKLSTLEKGTEEYKKLEAQMADCAWTASDVRIKINNMRTEMARSETQLREFRQGLEGVEDGAQEAVHGIEEVAKSAGGGEGGIASFAEKLQGLTGISLPKLKLGASIVSLGAMGWQALQMGNDETRAWNQMAAYTGATGEELEALMETAKALFGDAFGADLQESVRGVALLAQNTGLSGEELDAAARSAFLLSDMLGYDVAESSRTARMLMEKFGIDGQEAYDIIATAAQNGADKNGNLLDVINEYGTYFADAGFSAEEFGRALVNATENGVYDVDKVGDGFKEFSIRMKEGSEETKAALTGLGLEATDIGFKFAQGGETARAATELVIAKLMEMEDPIKRNEYGVALFGTQWEDTGGAIVDCIDDVEGGLGDTQTALDDMNQTRMSDLDVQLEGLARRVGNIFSEFASPAAKEAAQFISDINSFLDGKGMPIAEAEIEERMETLKAQGYSEIEAEQIAVGAPVNNPVLQWIVDWFLDEDIDTQADTGAQGVAQTVGTAMDTEMSAVMPDQGEAAIDYIRDGMDANADAMVTAGEEAGQEIAAGVESQDGEAQNAGEGLGVSAVDGAEDGLSGMEKAGQNSVDGLIDTLERAESRAYNAGRSAAAGFTRGYNTSMQIHSPSRVMMEAAKHTLDGLFDPIEEAQSEIYARGAALGEAFEGGYASAQGGQAGAGARADGGADISPEMLVGAFVEALGRVGVFFDADKVGSIKSVAGGVSRTISREGALTMSGVAARAKSW